MNAVDAAPSAATAGGTRQARRARVGGALAATAVATLVSAIDLGRPAPWIDEAATILAVQRPWDGLLALAHGADAPLVPYYIVLKLWLRLVFFVPALVGARMMSALAAGATVGVLYWLMTRRTGWRSAVAAGLVLIAMPGFGRFAQEARPYALLGLLVAVSWLAWSYHRWPPTPVAALICYPLALAAAVVTSLFGAFQWPSQAGALITARGRTKRQLFGMFAGFVVAGVLAAVPAEAAARHGTGPQEIGSTGAVDQLATLVQAVEVEPGHWVLAAATLVLAVVGLAAAVRGENSGERELAVMAAWWLTLPTALSLIVVCWHPGLLRPRYFEPALVPLALLAGLGIVAAARRSYPHGRGAAAALVAVLLGGVVVCSVPTQLRIRASDGHDRLTPVVLAAVDSELAQHPDGRLLVGGRLSAVLVVARPDLAARNVGAVVRRGSRQLWPGVPSRAAVAGALGDAHDLIWVDGVRDLTAPLPNRPPLLVHGEGFSVVSARRIGSWFVVVLRR